MSDMKQILENAMKTAQKLGAQNARASYSHAQSLSVSWRKNKIENMASSGESQLWMALYVDGKYGNYSTSDIRPESIDAFIEKCIAMTRLLEPEPARTLADPERYKDRYGEDLEIYDPAVAALTPNDAIEFCKKLEALALQHTEMPITDVTASYDFGLSESFMATTNGFAGNRKSTYVGASVEIALTDGEKKPSDYGYTQKRFVGDIRTAEDIVAEAIRFLGYRRSSQKLASKNRTLVFDRRVASSMVSKYLKPLFGGSLIMKNSYFLDKVGQKLASDLLDLHDEPWLKRGLSSRTYDSDGMSCKPATIFEKGTLKQYMLDVYSANKLSLTPTTGNLTNLVLTPGKRSLNEMIADVKDGIYVTSILGGNQDNVRGDFSHGISGVAIENGKLTQNIAEMNMTGNHTDLWNRLVEVGNDPREDSSYRIPSLRIDDVSVSGT